MSIGCRFQLFQNYFNLIENILSMFPKVCIIDGKFILYMYVFDIQIANKV